ncbi:MAG: YfhO family protein [Candidatus Omnitrophica bacterium]|nr:YfhO family protein [Candidatus Omnitrophota bacterium]
MPFLWKDFLTRRQVWLWIALAFGLWIAMFWNFFAGTNPLTSDALSYFEHTMLFAKTLTQGHFPLWSQQWAHGAPNQFFLQRIGCYNPVYEWAILFKALGASDIFAYLLMHALYYFLGMIGFFLLLKRIYSDDVAAFTGMIVLFFSALGTRMFDSYMLIIVNPLIWFFFFLVAFTQERKVHFFLGIIVTLMILETTYIPFFVLTILVGFVLVFPLVYAAQLGDILRGYRDFACQHKKIVIVGALLLMMASVPSGMLFQKMKEGSMALPGRHVTSALPGQDDALKVDAPARLSWAIPEDILFSSYFWEFHRFRLSLLYIPFFAWIMVCLGAVCGLNRRIIFYLLFGGLFFILGSPFVLPLYDFLFKHVFYFKYFRNLHFFLWFLLLPLFAVLLAEFMHQVFQMRQDPRFKKTGFGALVIVVHGALIGFLLHQGGWAMGTLLTVIGSLVFFMWVALGRAFKPSGLIFAGLLLIVAVEPFQVYRFLVKNTGPVVQTGPSISRPAAPATVSGGNIYYGSAWFNFLNERLDAQTIGKYFRYRFVVYDDVAVFDEKAVNLGLLVNLFRNEVDIALVAPGKLPRPNIRPESLMKHAQGFGDSGEGLKVLNETPNTIRIKTSFPVEKFLVYNDSYDKDWQVYVNGRRATLYRANVAFKGVWLNAGENVVEFRYGPFVLTAFHVLLLAMLNVFFYAIGWLWWQDSRRPV